jgi:peptidoglycan/LPS O-acetylase OafA/YrhL
MPRPVSGSATYLPGLDGLRAIAVVAVIGYHVGVPWLEGGLLGVGMFFTLSGYLITMILVREWDRTGGIDLRNFWVRRARRLLPAVIVLLLVVLAATALVAPWDLGTRLWESLAAMLYVSNWTTIAAGVSYFDRFGGPGALDHLWSLAVEEQFYVVWPLLFLGLLRAWRGRLSRVAQATLVLAALSFVLMAVVAVPGFDNTRAYEGTDTRAGGLLIGAAVAMAWRPDRLTARIAPRARLVLDGIGVVALGTILWLFVATAQHSMWLYRGGILTLSIATVALVAVVVHPASRLGNALGGRSLVWIGERSYGIYLWHLPIIAFTPAAVWADQPLLRAGMQVALAFALAAVSWTYLEDPIRRHGLRALLHGVPRPRGTARPAWSPPAVAVSTAALVVLGTASLAAVSLPGGTTGPPSAASATFLMPSPPSRDATPAVPGGTPGATADDGQDAGLPARGLVASGAPTAAPSVSPSAPAATATPSPAAVAPTGDGPRTACTTLVHVGDSTSIGFIDDQWVPDEDKRVAARYASVGVETFIPEIHGAMSTVEPYKDRPNATTLVERRMAEGYDGCWVFAMGTNEAANVSAGGPLTLGERIDLLMEPIGDGPALWLTLKSTTSTGPWADAEMQKMNEALLAACDRYPNMRVYDWRSEAPDEWFLDDDIHFTQEGFEERGQRLATALTRAFPADGPPSDSCVVRGDPA